MKQQTKIPENWKLKEIKEIFSVETGTTPPTKEKIYWENATINWATPADLGKLNGNIHFQESERKISKTALNDINLTLMPKNTIIVSTRAPVGYAVVIKKESTFNQGCKGLIPKKENDADPYFYCYYLINKKYELQNRAGQSTFKELSKDMFESFEVLHPPFEEQKAISKIFSEVDLELDSIERERQATERLKRGIMVRLLEGKKWKVVKLGEIVEFAKGKKPQLMIDEQKEDYLPYLSTDYLRENLGTKYVSPSEDVVLVKNGEIILLWDGSNAGEFFEGKEGVLSTTMVKFDLKTDIHQKYLLYLLKSKQFYLQGQTNGTGIPHVDRKVLMNLDISLPLIEEQKHIAEILNTLDQKLELELKRKDKLERIKKGLMNDLLAGNKRVNIEKVLKIGGGK
ncbi:MAG: restriction endonuclease subunit S [Candidatus Nanoarchaeia archaeon]